MRIFQGIVSAPLETLVTSTVSDLFFVHQRGLYLSLWNVMLGTGVLVGQASLPRRWSVFHLLIPSQPNRLGFHHPVPRHSCHLRYRRRRLLRYSSLDVLRRCRDHVRPTGGPEAHVGGGANGREAGTRPGVLDGDGGAGQGAEGELHEPATALPGPALRPIVLEGGGEAVPAGRIPRGALLDTRLRLVLLLAPDDWRTLGIDLLGAAVQPQPGADRSHEPAARGGRADLHAGVRLDGRRRAHVDGEAQRRRLRTGVPALAHGDRRAAHDGRFHRLWYGRVAGRLAGLVPCLDHHALGGGAVRVAVGHQLRHRLPHPGRQPGLRHHQLRQGAPELLRLVRLQRPAREVRPPYAVHRHRYPQPRHQHAHHPELHLWEEDAQLGKNLPPLSTPLLHPPLYSVPSRSVLTTNYRWREANGPRRSSMPGNSWCFGGSMERSPCPGVGYYGNG